jgi:hypothetical protein
MKGCAKAPISDTQFGKWITSTHEQVAPHRAACSHRPAQSIKLSDTWYYLLLASAKGLLGPSKEKDAAPCTGLGHTHPRCSKTTSKHDEM